MKKLVVLIALFVFAIGSSQEYTVLHINSSWNYRNDYKDLDKIKGAKILKAFLEDQTLEIKNQIKSVEEIKGFSDNGYHFDPSQSSDLKPVFTRSEVNRIAA